MADDWESLETAFTAADGYTYTEANKVASNINLLHRGNGYPSSEASLIDISDSTDDADIDMVNQAFYFNYNTLRSIRYTDGSNSRSIGNIIYLKFGQATTVYNNSLTPPANYANVVSGTDLSLLAGQTKGFMWDGTNWSAIV